MSARSPRSVDDAAIRRRRITAVVVLVFVGGGIALGVSSGSSSGGQQAKFVSSGASVTVISPAGPSTPRAAPKPTRFTPTPAAVSTADSLPLARQVSQLFLVGLDGTSPSAVPDLGSIDWGGVVIGASNPLSATQAAALAAEIALAVRRAGGTPPLVAAAQPGGPGTAFPHLPPQAEPTVGASADPAVAAAQATAAARQLRSMGFNMTLAPLADVDTPGGPLSGRLFSSDPTTVAQMSIAAVDAYIAGGVIAAVGHFPGTGGASSDPDQTPATVGGTLGALRARDLIPFAALAPKAPVIVMSNAAYAAFDGVTPAALLPETIDLLRRDYAYAGVIMSDDIDATLQATGLDPGSAALQALKAGEDLVFISGSASEQQAAYQAVLAAARSSGPIRALIRAALVHVLSLKMNYGILR